MDFTLGSFFGNFSRDPIARNFLGSFLNTNSFILLIQAYGSCAALVNFVLLLVIIQGERVIRRKSSVEVRGVGGVFLFS